MKTKKRIKFKHVKGQAHGFVAKAPAGELVPQTFVSRRGNSKIKGPNMVWRKLLPYLGYTQFFDKKGFSVIIKKLVIAGWRVAPVRMEVIPHEE